MIENKPKRSNTLAIVSLVLAMVGVMLLLPAAHILREISRWDPGIPGFAILRPGYILLAVTVVLGLIACILGVIALNQTIHKSQDSSDHILASSGIIVGIFACLLVCNIAVSVRTKLNKGECMENMRKISMALIMYSEDYDDRLPPLDKWNKYAGSADSLICPSAGSKTLPSYALNSKLRGVSLNDVEKLYQSVLIFDSVPGNNQSGGPELLPLKPRHNSGENYCFVDGHAGWAINAGGRHSKSDEFPVHRL